MDQKKLDKELSQIIYITITETPTNILFYCPSTKYLNLKNGKFKIPNDKPLKNSAPAQKTNDIDISMADEDLPF